MGITRVTRRRIVNSDDEDETGSQKSLNLVVNENEPRPSSRSAQSRIASKRVPNSTQSNVQTKQANKFTQSSNSSPKKSSLKSKSSNAVAKDQNGKEPSAKPIYSFFNAATQRQSLSQPSASPEKLPSQSDDLVETIHDGSDDEAPASLTLTSDSKTALALRKRKVPRDQPTEPLATTASSVRQKFRKGNDGSRTPSLSVTNEDKRPWTEQFAPIDLTELAVHSRKVRDVRHWLENAFQGKRPKILALKGATGTGKTITIRLLAKDMGLEILEWKNPVATDLAAEGPASAASQFEDFLGRTTRTASLALETSVQPPDDVEKSPFKQLLLIEEFPGTFSLNSSALLSFRSALSQYMSGPAATIGSITPIVLVISETLLSTNTSAADSFTAHRLLGPNLVSNPHFNAIEFNPIAPTILMKALELILVKEARKSGRRRAPGAQVLKHLISTGDIRSAISSLEFLCLRSDDDAWSNKVSFTKTKKSKAETPLTKAEEDALKLVSSRETSLGIFHAVGRVLYNNRILPLHASDLAQPPSWLSQHHRAKVPEKDVNSLIDELGADTPTFIAGLHENYLPSCTGPTQEAALDVVSDCMNNLSDADLLCVDRFSFGTRAFSGSAPDSIRQDEMAFQIAARGLLFSLPHPVHRKTLVEGGRGEAFRMYYPVSLRIWKKREEIEGTLETLVSRLSYDAELPQAQSSGGRGVDSWQRSKNIDLVEPNGVVQHTVQMPRTEMLMEHLPYLAQILAARSSQPKVNMAEQLATVTQVSKRTPIDEDDDGTSDEEQGSGQTEQWSTDQPETEIQTGKKRKTGLMNRRKKAETEGGGLAFPVERDVEKLVLEDDDISDNG